MTAAVDTGHCFLCATCFLIAVFLWHELVASPWVADPAYHTATYLLATWYSCLSSLYLTSVLRSLSA